MSQNEGSSNGSARRPAQKMLVSEIRERPLIFPDNRVSVVGIVVSSDSSQFLLDDGAQIAVRYHTESVSPGEAALVIARVQGIGADVYLTSEVVKKVDALWVKVRQIELLGRKVVAVKTEAVISLNESHPHEYITHMIRSLDSGEGVLVDEIVRRSSFDKCKEIIDALIREGDVFEIEPGRVKALE